MVLLDDVVQIRCGSATATSASNSLRREHCKRHAGRKNSSEVMRRHFLEGVSGNSPMRPNSANILEPRPKHGHLLLKGNGSHSDMCPEARDAALRAGVHETAEEEELV